MLFIMAITWSGGAFSKVSSKPGIGESINPLYMSLEAMNSSMPSKMVP
jgi:hypothetical protein